MRGAGLLALGMVVAACGASRPPWRPSETMERSARILRQLDALEADLHQGAAETDTYALLVARHGDAEQIACKVTDEHVEEIHRLAVAQQEKIQERLRERHAHRKKLARAFIPARHFASR